MKWKGRLVVVCAIVSSAAVATVTLRGLFDVRSATSGAGSLSDGSLGMLSSLFAESDGRRLMGQNSEGPDHRLPLPTTKACISRQTLSPTLFIIGFQLSGAKSLSKWMNLHPELSYGDVAMHKQYCMPWHDHVRSGRTYAADFKTGCSTKQTFDATPYAYQMAFENSTHCHFRGTTGLKAFGESIGPESRFIVLLRDPVDRLNQYVNRNVLGARVVSHRYEGLVGYEDTLIMASQEPCNAEALDIWLQAFPRERFLFVKSEELYSQPQQVLNQVFDFAGVAPRKYSPSELRYLPKKPIKHRPSTQVRQQYHDSHGSRECAERLQRLTGLEFDWPGVSSVQGLSSEQGLSSTKLTQPGSCMKLLKPTAFYIGFGHAGSWMWAELMQAHPELAYGITKEHYYWCMQGPRPLESWYAEFLVPCETKIAFDGCPMLYEMGAPPGTKNRCANLQAFQRTLGGGSENKFIVMVRNPAYWMHSHFPDAKVLPEKNYMFNPCFADYLEPFLEVIPRHKFLFLRAEDLFTDAQPVMNQVFEFLGVGPHLYATNISERNVNQHVKSSLSTEEVERYLNTPRMVECKARLERLTGMEFDWRPNH